jgi:hypothetical protein
MRKKLRHILFFLLAVLFILEAWLWELTGVLVGRVVSIIPFDHFKEVIAHRVEHLSPWLTLGVFIIPVMILFPLKVVAVILFAKGHVFGGVSTVIFAKLAGLGITSFLFAVCKPKLLQLRAVKWLYEQCIYWRQRALDMVAPYMENIRETMRTVRNFFPRSALLEKLRQRAHKARKTNDWKDWYEDR